MNTSRLSLPAFGVSAGLVLSWGGPVAAGTYPHYTADDADARIQLTGQVSSLMSGDINGDGIDDLLLAWRGNPGVDPPTLRAMLGSGKRLPRESNLQDHPLINFYLGASDRLAGVMDLNSDGRDDLFLWGSTTLKVWWGREDWPAEMDLRSTPDLAIDRSGDFMAPADVDGDGRLDAVFAKTSFSSPVTTFQNYTVYGSSSFPATVSVSDPGRVLVWSPSTFLYEYGASLPLSQPFIVGDNAGPDDLWVRVANGVTLVRGSTTRRTSLDVNSTVFPRIAGATQTQALCSVPRGGQTGASVIVWTAPSNIYVIDGEAAASAAGTSTPEELGAEPLEWQGNGTFFAQPMGDFDGDGRGDAALGTIGLTGNSLVSLFLSSEDTDNATLKNSFDVSFSSIGFLASFSGLSLDGDSIGDMVSFAGTSPFSNGLGTYAFITYGFSPLRSPSIRVLDRDTTSKRATLALSVSGQPTEMKIGGSVENDFKDQWIPFRSPLPVRLSGEVGTKTVSAVFRNAAGRESAPVSTGFPLVQGETSLMPATNRLVHGRGRIEIDCRISGRGVRASIYERGGRCVRTFIDDDATGIATVPWDGLTENGQPARPGVYVMTVDFDGKQESTEVLIEP